MKQTEKDDLFSLQIQQIFISKEASNFQIATY